MKKSILLLIAAFSLLLAIQVAFAEVTAPTDVTVVDSSRRDLSSLPTQTVNVLAGNVTQLSIEALTITKSWAGFYGNVSGVITLDDGSSNTFYNWTMTSTDGEIFATRVSTVDFSSVKCMNTTEISNEDTALNNDPTAADSVTNTFSGTTHPSFAVGTTTLAANSCHATNAFGPSGQGTDFYQVLLSDGSSNTIYTALMNGSKAGFNGHEWDFELLVGEDGHGNTATTQYYFWVELN